MVIIVNNNTGRSKTWFGAVINVDLSDSHRETRALNSMKLFFYVLYMLEKGID